MDQPAIAAERPAICEATAETEPRHFPRSHRIIFPMASVALLGMAIFSVVYAFLPTFASPGLLEIDPSPVFACKAREGDTVVANFVVKNITSQPIKLLGIKAGCSCTVSEGLPLHLAAGESGKVRVHVHVGHFDKTNMFTRSAEIFTNRDGTIPPLVIRVSEDDSPRSP
jgi:hypothetical protein